MYSRLVRIVSIILVAVTLMGLLAACGGEDATSTPEAAKPDETGPAVEPGELEVGVLWEEGNAWYDMVVEIGESLEADYPGTKVTYTFNNMQARPALDTRWQGGDAPDVDILFDGMDPNTYDWVTGGYLMDLTPHMNEARPDGTAWKDDFLPLFYPAMTHEDKFYAVPEGVYIILLHYNKKMFDDWGLSPPETWDELLEVCETIKGKGVAPIIATGLVDYYVGMWSDYLFQRYVGTERVMEYLYGDTDMKIADDPDFLKAAQEMRKLTDNKCVIEDFEGMDFTTSQVYYFQDRAAMILMGSWLMAEMKETIPEGFELAVAGFPSVDGGKGSQDAMFGRAISWVIDKNTKVPGLALEYMKRFTSREVAARRADELGTLATNRGVAAPPGIGGAEKVLEDAANAEFIYYHWGTTFAKFGLQSAWYDPIVQMWAGKLTPEEALAKIDDNMEAVRDQRATASE